MAPRKVETVTQALDWKTGKGLFKFEPEVKLSGADNWVKWLGRILRVLRAIGYAPDEPEAEEAKGKDVALEGPERQLQPGGIATAEVLQYTSGGVFPKGNMTDSDRLIFGAVLIDCIDKDIQGSVEEILYGDDMMTILSVTYGQPMDQFRSARLKEKYENVKPDGLEEEDFQRYVNDFRKAYLDCKQAGVGTVTSVDEVLWSFVERVGLFYPDWAIRQQARLLAKEKVSFEILALDLVRYNKMEQTCRRSAGTALSTQSGQPKSQQKGQYRESWICWNCGKKGHKKADCPDEKKADDEAKDEAKEEAKKDETSEREKNALPMLGGVRAINFL